MEAEGEKEEEQVGEEKLPADDSNSDNDAVCDTGTIDQQPIDCNI
jgi:hypothetical protein